jgi:hypothetical protein
MCGKWLRLLQRLRKLLGFLQQLAHGLEHGLHLAERAAQAALAAAAGPG